MSLTSPRPAMRRAARAAAAGAAAAVLCASALAQSPPAAGRPAPALAAEPAGGPAVAAPAPSLVTAVAPVPPDAFTVLDARFRAEVDRARRVSATQDGPVILAHEGVKLVLLRDRRRDEAAFVPATDHVLRSVAALPIALHAALATWGDGELTPGRHTELSQYQSLIADAQRSLVGRGFQQAVLDRQQEILAASAKLLEEVLADRKVDRSELADFARDMAPLVIANDEEAERARIDGLHAAVSRWRRELPPEEWSKLRVVVIGDPATRQGDLATRYFLKLLDEPAEGRRVIFAEDARDEASALDELGTRVLDRASGSAFFGSESASQREKLAVAARAYLDALNPGAPEPPPAPPAEPADTGKKKKKKSKEIRPVGQN